MFDATVEAGQTLNVQRVGRLIDDGTVRRSVGRTWVEENDRIYRQEMVKNIAESKLFWKFLFRFVKIPKGSKIFRKIIKTIGVEVEVGTGLGVAQIVPSMK